MNSKMSTTETINETGIDSTSKETRGRKRKYATLEEAHAARLKQMREWRQRKKLERATEEVKNIYTKESPKKYELKLTFDSQEDRDRFVQEHNINESIN